MAEICPISDDKKCSSDNFPLPDHHWINKPYKDHNYKTLLFLAIEKGNPGLTRILISAGAKAEAGAGADAKDGARTGAGSGAVAEISNSIASKRQPRSQAFNKKHRNQKRGKGQKWVKICKWILRKHTKTIPPHL